MNDLTAEMTDLLSNRTCSELYHFMISLLRISKEFQV